MQTLAAFESLWQKKVPVHLVIVGAEGWKSLPDDQRCNIPEIMQTILRNRQLGKKLFFLEGVNDEQLNALYENSTCLIAASEGEGFGLPLIEASRRGLPIIARDIPVFREVAGMHAYYFDGLEPATLAKAINEWLNLYANGRHPKSSGLSWLTWKESVEALKSVLLAKH